MNPILAFYLRKTAQQSYTVNWPNQLDTKKVKAPLY